LGKEISGARTPVSGLIAAFVTLVIVLFASGLLRNLPQPVLAAIVLAAVLGLFDVHALKTIWRFSRAEFAVAMAALVGVLGSGPVNGVLLGAAISIVLLLRQASRPRVTELARVAGTTHFADFARDPLNERQPGVLVIRCESSLLYFNVEYVRERVFELIADRPEPVRLVVLSLATVPFIDLAGAELIAELHRTLNAQGIGFRLANAQGQIRDALGKIGFDRDYGTLETGQTVEVVVGGWRGRR
jgi:sulfate permease, SulP family